MCRKWNIIKLSKYSYRTGDLGTYNEQIAQLIPRGTDAIFLAKTLMTSIAKPCGSTKNGEKISKATKEYYYHAAKLSLRFYSLVRLMQT